MCGIVGYVGRRPGKPIILDGLRRLEYRGYDSAGIALIEPDGIDVVRAVGNLDELFEAAGDNGSEASVGLGHTRWATHGRPNEVNAHPHDDCTGSDLHRRQRHRRELQGAARSALEPADTCSRARPTPRSWRTSSKNTSSEGLTAAVCRRRPDAAGPLRLLRRVPRRARHRRRHAQRVPARGRRRRGRDVLRLRHPCVPGAYADHRRARGRRRGHASRRRRRVLRRRRRRRSCAKRSRFPGTTTPPRRAATRRSCSRRSTSSRPRCATRSPAACARTAPWTSPRSRGWATSSCAACGASSSSPAAPRTTRASS